MTSLTLVRAGPALRAATDPRVGGHFFVRLRAHDGSDHDSCGEYQEMEWPGESLVEIDLRAVGDGTELTQPHARLHDEETRRGHEEGWNAALDKLVRHFSAINDRRPL